MEQWRPLTATIFPPDLVDRVLCLIDRESGGNPTAVSSAGARGLMQVMPLWAGHYSLNADALFDPATNLRVAARIVGEQGWDAWTPWKRGHCQ